MEPAKERTTERTQSVGERRQATPPPLMEHLLAATTTTIHPFRQSVCATFALWPLPMSSGPASRNWIAKQKQVALFFGARLWSINKFYSRYFAAGDRYIRFSGNFRVFRSHNCSFSPPAPTYTTRWRKLHQFTWWQTGTVPERRQSVTRRRSALGGDEEVVIWTGPRPKIIWFANLFHLWISTWAVLMCALPLGMAVFVEEQQPQFI